MLPFKCCNGVSVDPDITFSGASVGFSNGERGLNCVDGRPGTFVASSGTSTGGGTAAETAAETTDGAGAWASSCASGTLKATPATTPPDRSNSRRVMTGSFSGGVFTCREYCNGQRSDR